MAAYLFDTECTDLEDPEVIEAAWIEVEFVRPLVCGKADAFSQRYKPSKPISFGAMATHHIVMEDLDGCPPSSSFHLPIDADYIIGHNIDFDWKAARSPEDTKRICTAAMARLLWPTVDSHSLSALLYYHCGVRARELLKNAHSAITDCQNCGILLNRILAAKPEIESIEQLWLFSEDARIPRTMYFGKHNGLPICELPSDYVEWLLRQAWLPIEHPYLHRALKQR